MLSEHKLCHWVPVSVGFKVLRTFIHLISLAVEAGNICVMFAPYTREPCFPWKMNGLLELVTSNH